MGTCPEWIVRRHLSLHRGAGVYPANRHPYQCRSVFSPTKTNPTPPCRPKGTTYKNKPHPTNVGRALARQQTIPKKFQYPLTKITNLAIMRHGLLGISQQ